jgi:hypothetical protein
MVKEGVEITSAVELQNQGLAFPATSEGISELLEQEKRLNSRDRPRRKAVAIDAYYRVSTTKTKEQDTNKNKGSKSRKTKSDETNLILLKAEYKDRAAKNDISTLVDQGFAYQNISQVHSLYPLYCDIYSL